MEQNANTSIIGALSMSWTDARIAQLRRLWTAGVSAAGIAEALGDVSRSAVLGKLYRLDLLGSRKPASPPRRYEGPSGAHLGLRRAPIVRRDLAQPKAAPSEPPSAPWREQAFTPLPGTLPRPWLSRASGECAFPVGGEGEALVSCCAAVRPRSAYCPGHHPIVFKSAGPADLAAERQRWTQQAERWAA
jgi:GcrA cell cycle regulator